ncbi:transcription factor gsfR2 [Penicillium samsonianum]|uniref:transcription factor gsfR2 n=1 Tax=Penicillium samsonianum TaxID=1882272 RepID=UPI0025499231|nr:transcription factor gsfR2 [Penicillium samsonianum]KAJ6150130.1 transcription factor gsfR2 [Penicillium samsonianum]
MLPSRQKSCLACVQSKRKCDKGLPKCQRCLAKKTDCEYHGQYPDRLRQTTGRNVDENVAFAEPFAEGLSSDWQLQRSPALPSAAILSPRTNDAFFNFGNDPFNLASIPQDDFFSSAVIEDIVARQNSNGIGQMISDTTSQARVEFVAKRLAVVPKTFSESGQTMFIHRLLFQERSPPALQDALSACALYCMKNTENQLLIFRNLEHRRQQLIANTDPLLASKMNLLEALQALILYQIIRLFDGDIRLRAQAEADEPVLIMWAAQLRLRTHQVQLSSPAPAEARLLPGSTFRDWQRWLIEESCRRTVITAFMLKGVYEFLKLGYDTVPDLRMSFTAQAALWNSQSEISWRKAYSERERLEVRVTHWDEAIAKAKPGDLEELGVLIMAMLKGIEATGEWLGHTHFIRYGLEGAGNSSI